MQTLTFCFISDTGQNAVYVDVCGFTWGVRRCFWEHPGLRLHHPRTLRCVQQVGFFTVWALQSARLRPLPVRKNLKNGRGFSTEKELS